MIALESGKSSRKSILGKEHGSQSQVQEACDEDYRGRGQNQQEREIDICLSLSLKAGF